MFGLEAIFIYILLGSFVGVVAGLFGIGGGGIIVPILTIIFSMQGLFEDNIMHMALGTSMATIVVTSISSIRAHCKKDGVLWNVFKMMSPGIIIGTFFATFLASILDSFYLAVFFSIFMAYVSFQMFLNKKPKPNRKLVSSKVQFIAGTIIGAVSAMVSIGGGSLTVPYLLWQNIEMKKAIGTSAAIGFPIAVSGTLGYIINGWANTDFSNYIFGFVSLPAFFFISICSYFTAPLGVKLAHTLPILIIKKFFALLLLSLCIKMVFSFI